MNKFILGGKKIMDFEKIIQTGETQLVEFKKSLSQTKEGCKTIVKQYAVC